MKFRKIRAALCVSRMNFRDTEDTAVIISHLPLAHVLMLPTVKFLRDIELLAIRALPARYFPLRHLTPVVLYNEHNGMNDFITYSEMGVVLRAI